MKTEETQGCRATTEFQRHFAGIANVIVQAPGRVNLIGEHTDYNEGFVLPVAIDRYITIAARRRLDRQVVIYSTNYQEEDRVSLTNIERSDKQWCNYYRGVLSTMLEAGYDLSGFEAVIDGDLPQGAGLSSSAAYELAVAALCATISSLDLDKKTLALLSQKAENNFIGLKCGIMDQFASALCKADAALLIDCRSLSTTQVPLPLANQGARLVITNSGVRRGLVDSEYNRRRETCETGTDRIGSLLERKLSSLRDVTLADFKRCASKLPDDIARRCGHVITENERVLESVEALEKGDLVRLGQLMYASHYSLSREFEVSCPESDLLVELTKQHPGTYGSRMTGAGFGGCTVSVMEEAALDDYAGKIVPDYEGKTGKKAEIYLCKAVTGVRVQRDGEPAPLRDE